MDGSGPANSITDVPGLRVGHAHRVGEGWLTGCTVVLAPGDGAVGGVDVRGGGPGTRETDLLDPRNLVERVQAVLLTGGSAFGLAAADGVMRRLAAAGAASRSVMPASYRSFRPPLSLTSVAAVPSRPGRTRSSEPRPTTRRSAREAAT